MSTEKEKKLAVFQGKRIRKTLHEGALWFVIVDVVAALTDSTNPSGLPQRYASARPLLG